MSKEIVIWRYEGIWFRTRQDAIEYREKHKLDGTATKFSIPTDSARLVNYLNDYFMEF